MIATRVKTVSDQSSEVYRLLSRSGDMTARQIGQELNILPNSVYRAVNRLIALGMAEQLDTYPRSYRANSTNSALNWYLRAAAQSFRQDFNLSTPQPAASSPTPSITFINGRENLLARAALDAKAATKSINFIVSGHRVPDSTVLAYRKAFTVGAKLRVIIQNTPETSKVPLEHYHEMGAEVRYLPNIGIRLFIFDGHTVHLTSYDEVQSSKAFGIRFTHNSVAAQLNQLFEQRWTEATPLN